LSKDQWFGLIARSNSSPRMDKPFMIFMDDREVTLVLGEQDLVNMRAGLADAKIEQGYRMLTFDIVLELSVVGFIAEVSGILADANIPILPISAYKRDHVLIKQVDLATALKALGPHVADLC
jgi:hypothetical protein